MPIRRSILIACCLLIPGSASVMGQTTDPFAAWDRQKPKSTPTRPDPSGGKSTVTYFSATAEKEKADKPAIGTAAEAAHVRMRERSTVSPISSPAVRASRAENLPARTATPVQPKSNKSSHEPASTVRHAAFGSSDESSSNSRILKASQPNGAPSDQENPFANFLKNAEQSEPAPKEELSFPNLEDEPADDEESAEAIFGAAADPATMSTAPVTVADPAANAPKADSGPQSPGITVQWICRGEFNVGQECNVELVVQNTSKAVVRSVMTEAVIPAEVEFVEANPAPMQGSDTPMWTFGELNPGETRTVALKVIPHARGDVRLEAFVRLTGFSSSEFSVQEPLIGVAVAGPEKVEVGQQVAYVVRVSNPGTGVASNVVIQAAIPEGLEHRGGSLLSIEIGTLSPGESRQARLNLVAVKGGPQELAVRAIADGGLSDETAADVNVAEPQLNIAIGGPMEQLSGRTADYSLKISNAGNVQSSNVRSKYRIPEGCEFISADRGGKYNKTDHSIEWFVGTLQPGESSDFQMALKANVTGELLHQAGVVSEHGQVTMCDYATTVEGVAALDLKILSSSKALKKGDEVTWTVQISNNGSRPATSVGMSCELPSGIQLITADGPSEYIAENGVMVFRSIPSIDAGASVEFTVTAACIREGNHRLRLRVASESITEPLIGEESATVTGR